jgi:uncharacterized protein YvpB
MILITILMLGCDVGAKQKTSSQMVQQKPILHTERRAKENSVQKVILDAPIISQGPELKNGCEVTSLAMLLQYAGLHVGKMELSEKVPKDSDKLNHSGSGDDVTHWGNPDHGFVGDITGKSRGYAVYNKPLERLMQQYMPGRTENLTGRSFSDLQKKIRDGRPVVVWTTVHFSPPRSWDTWQHNGEQILATREEHAVLLVGFDSAFVYVNDPLTGQKAKPVDKRSFIASWNALGSQALSYR